jgi:hypothetical protein
LGGSCNGGPAQEAGVGALTVRCEDPAVLIQRRLAGADGLGRESSAGLRFGPPAPERFVGIEVKNLLGFGPLAPLGGGRIFAPQTAGVSCLPRLAPHHPHAYSDEKVGERNAKVWHGATENGP